MALKVPAIHKFIKIFLGFFITYILLFVFVLPYYFNDVINKSYAWYSTDQGLLRNSYFGFQIQRQPLWDAKITIPKVIFENKSLIQFVPHGSWNESISLELFAADLVRIKEDESLLSNQIKRVLKRIQRRYRELQLIPQHEPKSFSMKRIENIEILLGDQSANILKEVFIFRHHDRTFFFIYSSHKTLFDQYRNDALKMINSLRFLKKNENAFEGYEWEWERKTYTNPYYGFEIKKQPKWHASFTKFQPLNLSSKLITFLCEEHSRSQIDKPELMLEMPEVSESGKLYTPVRYAMILANRLNASKEKVLKMSPIEDFKISGKEAAVLRISLIDEQGRYKEIEIYTIMRKKQGIKMIYRASPQNFESCHEDALEMIRSFKFLRNSPWQKRDEQV